MTRARGERPHASGVARGRGRDVSHDERGDTLLEVLITVLVVSITSVALLLGFSTSISGSAAHRSLVANDVALRTVSQGVYAQVEKQSGPLYYACATSYGTPTPSNEFNAPAGFDVLVQVTSYWINGAWVSSVPSGFCNGGSVPATPQQLLITVTTPNNRTLTTTIVVNQPLALVTTFDITSMSPPSAPPGASAQSVLISGNGFVDGVTGTFSSSAITFTGTSSSTSPATSPQPSAWTWVSSTSIIAEIDILATAPTGPVTFTLTNPDGTTTTATFTISTAPAITNSSPSTFLPGQSSVAMTLTGDAFVLNGSTVSFPNTNFFTIVGNQTVVSTTSITMTVNVDPNTVPGTYYVQVTNPDGQFSNLYALTVATPPPTITSVADTSGAQPCAIALSGSTTCNVTGTAFYAPVTVSITPSAGNLNACTPTVNATVNSLTSITLALTQPGSCTTSGSYDLTVIAKGGTSAPYTGFSN